MEEYTLRLIKGGGITGGLEHPAGDGLHLFIGLGGAGIQCLRTLKTRMGERLAPCKTGPQAPFSLLGIDCDPLSQAERGYLLPLAEQEWLWLPSPGPVGERGPSTRQNRHHLFLENWALLRNRIFYALRQLQSKAPGLPLFVHILTGLGGNTGSGCFLDLCYLLRLLARDLEAVTLCGYFFLPQMMVSVIPPENDAARSAITANSYAALQELDYCMGFPQNGGSFVVTCPNGERVPWREPPLDLACLVACGEDENHLAYRWTMERTVGYLMAQLLLPGFRGRLAAFEQQVQQRWQTRTDGGCPRYGLLQGDAVLAPLREVQTLLATLLFERWESLLCHSPTGEDAGQMACKAVGCEKVQDLYENLFLQLTQGAETGDLPCPPDWKSVSINGIGGLLRQYADRTEARMEQTLRNLQQMMADSPNSLMGRLCRQLKDAMTDPDRGPLWVGQMLDAGQEHSFMRLVDGLLEENARRQQEEYAQENCWRLRCDSTRTAFEKAGSLFGNAAKKFADYVRCLQALEQHRYRIKAQDAMTRLLWSMRTRLAQERAEDSPPAQVLEKLFHVFLENRAVLKTDGISRLLPVQRQVFAALWPQLGAVELADAKGLLGQFLTQLVSVKDGRPEAAIPLVKSFIKAHFPQFFQPFFVAELDAHCGAGDHFQLVPVSLAHVCGEMDEQMFRHFWLGQHLFETQEAGMPFGDWRQLPPLVPLSQLSAPFQDLLAREIQQVKALFFQGKGAGLLGPDGRLTGWNGALDGRGDPQDRDRILLDSFWQAPALQRWMAEKLNMG